MSERGVFAVDRGIWDHPMFKPNQRFCEYAAWQWMIGEAQWGERRIRRGRTVAILQRGQLAASRAELARRWKWSDSEVRGFLQRAENEGAITRESTNDTTIITLCNYDKHQFGTPAEQPATSQPLASHSPAANQHTKKEIKEEGKKEKKERGPRAKARTPISENWQVSEKGRDYARESGFDDAMIANMRRRFINNHASKGNLMADWEAAWRTWCDNEVKFNANRSVVPMRGPPSKAPTFHEIARNLSGTPDDDPSEPPAYDLDLRAYSAH